MKAATRFCLMVLLTGIPVPGSIAQQTVLPAEPAGPDYLEMGNAAFEAGDFDAAVDALARVSPLEIPPAAQNRLAVSYFMLGRERDAEGTYRLAMNRDRGLAPAYNNLGVLYYAREDFDDAEDRFKDAAERDPDNPNVQDNLHAAKYARENRDEAREQADRIRETSALLVQRLVGDMLRVEMLIPEEVEAQLADLETRGDIFLARKMFEDASIEYERSIRIDRYDPQILNKLGIAYLQLEELDNADRQFKEALKVNPSYLPALNNLGSVEQARNRYDRALDYYRGALEIRPEWSVVLQNIGALFFALERYEEGLEMYIRALRSDPTLFEVEKGDGLPTLAQATRRNEAMTNFYMAKLFASIGDADRTMSYLYRAVEEGFDDEGLLSDAAFGILAEDQRFLQLVASIRESE